MNKPGPRTPETVAADSAPAPVTPTDASERPYWPLPLASAPPPEDVRAHAERFFHQLEGAQTAVPGDAWPALLHRYRRIERIRHAYPLLVPDATDAEIQPLEDVIEAAAASVGAQGDEFERLKRDLFRLETHLRAGSGPRKLTPAWEAAVDAVRNDLADRPDALERFDAHQQSARRALVADGRLLHCDRGVARRLLDAQFRRWWPRHCEAFREEIDAIIRGLDDILKAEFERSEAARNPDHLRDAVGTADVDDLDFDRLSDILTRSQLERPLPEGRHARIEQALSTLKDARNLFDDTAFEQAADLNIDLSAVHNHIREAARRHARRMDLMSAVFRDAAIGRLEIDNRYREARHDPWFSDFGPDRFEPGEQSLCPPVLLSIDGGFDHRGGAGDLMSLLMSGLPVKVVVELGGHAYQPHPPWITRLADLARSLNRMWVAQATAADPHALQMALNDALDHEGPAVLVVYTGLGEETRLPGYLDCAATLEARAVPAWRDDPAAGPTQAERLQLLDNPAPEDAWSSEAIDHQDVEGEQTRVEMPFTLADLLLCDRRLGTHFLVLPAGDVGFEPVSLDAYLEASPEARDSRLPMLTAIRENGEMLRVVPDRWVVEQVLRCAEDWRALQESVGIGNSHALRLLSRHQAELARERDEAIEAARLRYEDQLDQDVGELSREIVARIADGLLGTATTPAPPASAPAPGSSRETAETSAATAPPLAEAPTVEADQAEDEPEEDFALDDPYIDTPLCTSCDDCTKLNPDLFAYDENKQAYIKDATAGTFKELVQAAEKCPVNIIHPGKPANPDEPDLEDWIERAKAYQ